MRSFSLPISIICAAAIALPLSLQADCPDHQFQDAREAAAKQKKDVLMVLTGSTWSGQSKKFEAEILSNDIFKKGIAKNFVHVILDFPAKREEAHESLIKLRDEYQFRQMPSVILTDQAGRPYAYTGANGSDPKAYLEQLEKLHAVRVERDQLFEKAHAAKGHEKAKIMVEALKKLPQHSLSEFYGPELAYASEADPEKKLPFLTEVKKAESLRKEQARFNKLFNEKKFDEVVKQARVEAKKLKGEDAQRLKMYEARALVEQGKFDEARKSVTEMGKIDPESGFGKRTQQYLSTIDQTKNRGKMLAERKKKAAEQARKPRVSKPVAIVNDINELRKDAQKLKDELKAAAKAEAEMSKNLASKSQEIAELEKQAKELRNKEKEAAAALSKAVEARKSLAARSKAMQEVVESHEAMERRKKEVSELQKKAAEMQKKAAEMQKNADALRKKAEDLRKGKK